MSLAELEAEVARDLMRLDHGGPDWVRPRTDPEGRVHDVVVIVGGQSGLAAAFGLLRERISNILVIDENPQGLEGPWDTYARMATLRTPKTLTGVDLGIASLTFRAFWEAQPGAQGWAALTRIPRRAWMDYLRWYRDVLALPVRNGARLALLEPRGDGVHRLHLADGAPLLARKVVLATGIQGGGEWHVPPMVRERVSRKRYAHTCEPIDYAALKGRRVAILGGGASAFDNASAALEAGTAEAHVFVRRPELARVNPIRFMERAAMGPRYPGLGDAAKYQVMAAFFRRNQPPTLDMFERAAGFPEFRLHLASPWIDVMETPAGVEVTTPHETRTFDFLVLSTGLVNDPALRPELRLLAPLIARWSDRYSPPPRLANPLIDAHPCLGPGFQFLPRRVEDAARLHGVFAFNYSALISLGLSAAALSGLKHALPRLVAGVADELFQDDQAVILADYEAYDEIEFPGEWPRADAAEAAA